MHKQHFSDKTKTMKGVFFQDSYSGAPTLNKIKDSYLIMKISSSLKAKLHIFFSNTKIMVICEGLITLLLLTYYPLKIVMKIKKVSSMVLSIVESQLSNLPMNL